MVELVQGPKILSLLYMIFIYLFWAVLGLCCRAGISPLGVNESCSSCSAWVSYCSGFSLRRSKGFRAQTSVVAAHGLSRCTPWALEHRPSRGSRHSCSTACGIFPEQGSNPCLQHWLGDATREAPRLLFCKSLSYVHLISEPFLERYKPRMH